MERLRHVCHTEDRKVLVSIDRLDLCKVRGQTFDCCPTACPVEGASLSFIVPPSSPSMV